MLRRLALTLILLPATLLAPPAHAAEAVQSVEAVIDSVGESSIVGKARFRYSEPDTIAHVELSGLEPGAAARIAVYAGPCEAQGASFVALPDVTADSRGKATADGLLLFQEREPVDLKVVGDGEHSVSVTQSTVTVACGEISKLGEALPDAEAGDAAPPWILIAGVATVVVLLAGAALALSRRKKASGTK